MLDEHLQAFREETEFLLDDAIQDLEKALAAAMELRSLGHGTDSLWVRKRLWDEVGEAIQQASKTWRLLKPDGPVLEYNTGYLMRIASVKERKRERCKD